MGHGLFFTVELTITRGTALIAWSPYYTSRHMQLLAQQFKKSRHLQ
jgi:hypothetical protein